MQIQLRAPADVSVNLKFREGTRTARFSWAHRHETQLDFELEGRWDGDYPFSDEPCFTPCDGCVGIVVKGTLYVDDRVFWLGLLEEGATYQVAYSKPPDNLEPFSKIPQPDDRYTSSRMRAVLIQHGFLTPGNFQLKRYTTGVLEQDLHYEKWWETRKDMVLNRLKKSREYNPERGAYRRTRT
ncbi:hypothetical protein EDC01DRAFT_629740 [Geopyxis carbonaria]|nr:hypothetical protein EDC01DRAFT_629740 [Geopyxis carbonaria]